MYIKFRHDFGGRETGELRYVAGQVVNMEREVAEGIVMHGHAVRVLDPQELAELAVEVAEAESDEGASPPAVPVEHPPDEKPKGKGKGKRGKK